MLFRLGCGAVAVMVWCAPSSMQLNPAACDAGPGSDAGAPKRARKAPEAFKPTFASDRPLGRREDAVSESSVEYSDSDASAEEAYVPVKRQRRAAHAPSRLGEAAWLRLHGAMKSTELARLGPAVGGLAPCASCSMSGCAV